MLHMQKCAPMFMLSPAGQLVCFVFVSMMQKWLSLEAPLLRLSTHAFVAYML